MKILVVCVGNTCRSPVAERLLRARLTPGRHAITSAGVRATPGEPMNPHAAAELTRLGGDPSGFASQVASSHVIESADLVFTMTKDLRTDVLRRSPRMMRRTFTLGEFAAVCAAVPDLTRASDLVATAARSRSHGADAPDVPDPMGQSVEIHRQVADLIESLIGLTVPVLSAH